LEGPDGADLLQVLWCPVDHEDDMPHVQIFWRESVEIESVMNAPPIPHDVAHYGEYVPEMCIVSPEEVWEYPTPAEMDGDARRKVTEWSLLRADEYCSFYLFNLSVAPGWKVAGWAPWGEGDPFVPECTCCGADMTPLLTVASCEWDSATVSWKALDRKGLGIEANQPTKIEVGRTASLQIYVCAASHDHPILQVLQWPNGWPGRSAAPWGTLDSDQCPDSIGITVEWVPWQ
jgi:hypothetical protein